MATGTFDRARRLRADDDGEPEVDLGEEPEERAPATSRRAERDTRSRREEEAGAALDPEVLAEAIAEMTAERVGERLKTDERKVDRQLAEHERRLGDLEEANDEARAEMTKIAAKIDARATAAAPAAAGGATPAAGAREIAITEPDLGKDQGREDRLPDEPGGPKQPRGGWRSIW